MSDLENDSIQDDAERALEAELLGLQPKFDAPQLGRRIEADFRRRRQRRMRWVTAIILAAAACVAVVLFELHLHEPAGEIVIGPGEPVRILPTVPPPPDDSSFSLASYQSAADISPDALAIHC